MKNWLKSLLMKLKQNLHTNFGTLILHNETTHYFHGKLTGYPYREMTKNRNLDTKNH